MRIVYGLTSLGMGGAERQALDIAERMLQRGHFVALMVLRPPLAEQWPTTVPVTHLMMRKNPVSILKGLECGRQFLRDFKPDLIHSHSFHANMIARLLHRSAPTTPVVSTIHNVYEGGWLRMLAYRLTDPLSVRTTAVSQAAADRFIRLGAVPHSKCLVVHNGINVLKFSPDPERRNRVRNEMDLRGCFVWLAAGRVVPAKDYPNLLRAFAQAVKAHSHARLWITGPSTPTEEQWIRSHIASLGIVSQVRVLGLRRDMPALYDAADGFVQASAWEGMPLAIGEAMAMEKPVVATDVGGVGELVDDTGMLVPAKNSSALAESMMRIMELSRPLTVGMGQFARKRINDYFNVETKADEWEALYRALSLAS
jgi:glycosyltransferase involved in cell wall biosynthesis